MLYPRLRLMNWDTRTMTSPLRSIPFISGARLIWRRKTAPPPQANSKRFSIIASIVGNEPIGALAHLGLARAYSLSGNPTKSKSAYQDFFAVWKNADSDVPLLIQAKAEYAKLP